MRSKFLCAALVCIQFFCWNSAAHGFDTAAPLVPATGTLQAAFAPWDDVETTIVELLNSARRQVLMQAYLITSKRIAATLIAAHRRGVDVQVIADAEQALRSEGSRLAELAAAGIGVWLDRNYQSAHNKIIVIDNGAADAVVVTGSFNFTWTAQHKNAENVLIARANSILAARYADNWQRHRRTATRYQS